MKNQKIENANLILIDTIGKYENVHQITGNKSGIQCMLEKVFVELNSEEKLQDIMAILYPERYENGYL